MKRNHFEMLTLLGMVVSISTMVFLLVDKFNLLDSNYSLIVTAIVSATMAVYVSFIMKTLNKNATPLRAFVIGQPRAGKTVFLSILFDELQRISNSKIDFQQYGSETVEKVNDNIRILNQGKWVPRTHINTAFYYRARASVGKGAFRNKYTLEVGDYAGEHIDEFNTSSELWLHKSDYFKYALASDALLFCIDGEVLKNKDKDKIESSQAMLISAFQMLLAEKTTDAGQKLNIPISLVVLKCDLFTSDNEAKALLKQHYSRLTVLMSNKSKTYKEFFVSAVGETRSSQPPEQIQPENVCDPMLWTLTNTKL